MHLRHFGQRLTQQLQTSAGLGANPYTADFTIGIALDRRFDTGGVDLVPYQDLRHLSGPDFLQHAIHRLNLRITVAAGRIHHVQKKIGRSRFFQGGVKGRNEGMRQVSNESHRV